jgi:fimbrial chaperone protein
MYPFSFAARRLPGPRLQSSRSISDLVVRAGLIAICTAAPGATGSAFASSFTVNPTQVFLTSKSTSAILTLRNESDESLRFQLTVFAWDQSVQGEMKLQPTSDIVFFPTLLTLAPKESRNVRVGAATAFEAVEKGYRIFVEELPPQATQAGQSAVRVLTKMGIPIFLEPTRTQAQASLRDLMVKDGVFTFNIRNTGNVHFVPEAVRVHGMNRAGEVVLDKQLDGWYILAGGVRAYEVKLPAPDCSALTALSIDVRIAGSALKERLETPSACVP